MKKQLFILFLLTLISYQMFAQNKAVQAQLFDGFIVGGYVDRGAYLNFTGPNISFSYKNSKVILGMLPSLRFKKDNNSVHNSFVMPGLGAGISYNYKMWVFQIPVYYNPKTATKNGNWQIGAGVGLKLAALRKHNGKK